MSGARGLLRRFPVLVVAALGLWLWQGGGGLVPTGRTVSFRFAPGGAQPLRVEVQLYDASEHLLTGQTRTLRPGEALTELSLEVQSRPGALQARIFRWRTPAGPPEALWLEVPVQGNEAAVVVDVPPSSR